MAIPYSDIACQLCGVSFSITRIRTAEEPRSAAWLDGIVGSWVTGNQSCDETTDCSVVYRGLPGVRTAAVYEDEDVTEASDPTYKPPSESSDDNRDSLVYNSDASDDESITSSASDNDGSDAGDESDEWTFRVSGPDPPTHDVAVLPLSEAMGDSIFVGGDINRDIVSGKFYEHIAGPGCLSTEGFSGHRISIQEMRGCNAAQCLIKKGRSWRPEADDSEFERDTRSLLTGLDQGVPSMSRDLRFWPARHGETDACADMSAFSIDWEENLDDIGLPFHPTCFEIFRQTSLRLLGKVDVDGLMMLRDHVANNGGTNLVGRREWNARSATDQTLSGGGYEYLVANPVLIPALRPIIIAALSVGPDFEVEGSPFPPRRAAGQAQVDAFSKLPRELAYDIVGYLGSRDIAALRLVSRAFTHLPTTLWRRLLLDEMPWLYEVWSSDPTPYQWVTADYDELRIRLMEHTRAMMARVRDLPGQRDVIREELPEIYNEWAADAYGFALPPPQRCEAEEEAWALRPVSLPYGRTDWYLLYTEIKRNWGCLRGLRNRERIWESVQHIVEKIRKL